jgi:choline monooxygenase
MPPAEWYTSAAIAERERAAVFAAGPQYVCPAALVEKSGQFITAIVAGEPVLVVRGDDGRLRALSNVCRHRASAVVLEPCGKAETLRCPYHGWTYALDGRLRGAPEMETTKDFDRAAVRLDEFAAAVDGPFVFVTIDAKSGAKASRRPLPSDLKRKLEALDVGRLRHAARRTYEVGCNWKVYVDNYLDGGYHVPRMHPGLFSVLDYGGYRCELHDGWNVQIAPMKPPPADKADVGVVRSGETAFYFWLWPNFMINCYSGVMDTNLVVPLGIDRCAVVFDYYFTETGTPAAESFIEQSVKVAEQVQEEDRTVCEAVQRGLGSKHYTPGRYCARRENGDHQFHGMLARALKRPGDTVTRSPR